MSETCGALGLERFADSFRAGADIVRLPRTAPGPGEVRVRNRHCGVKGIFGTPIARNAVDPKN